MDGLTGNTLDSHRLIAAAGQQGPEVQDAVVEELFHNYFTQARQQCLSQYMCMGMLIPGLALSMHAQPTTHTNAMLGLPQSLRLPCGSRLEFDKQAQDGVELKEDLGYCLS